MRVSTFIQRSLFSFNFGVVMKIILAGAVLGFGVFLTQDTVQFREIFRKTKTASSGEGKAIELETVGLADAIRMVYAPNTVILDVRDKRYYEYGHIQGALSLPMGEIKKMPVALVEKLKQAPAVLVYCNATSCGSSYFAARWLMEKGLDNVRVYPEGWGEWSSCRLPIAMSPQMRRDVASERNHEK